MIIQNGSYMGRGRLALIITQDNFFITAFINERNSDRKIYNWCIVYMANYCCYYYKILDVVMCVCMWLFCDE